MFKEGTYVTTLGVFQVTAVGEEYVEIDPYGASETVTIEKYKENGFTEVGKDGLPKEFDGWQVGDFFRFDGKYKVLRSNDVFTKIEIDGHMISVPNHKIMEVA